VGLATLLMLWMVHSIFMQEAKSFVASANVWVLLPRLEQWKIAWQQGPSALWKTLTMIHPGAFLLSLVMMGLGLMLGVWRWRMVLRVQGLHLPLGRTTEISLVAHFFNSFLLGATGGDLMKAYYAARETHHKKTEAVVTVFVDRVVGLWAMLLFAVVMMIPNFGLLFENARLRIVAYLILAMTLGCSVAVGIAFWGGVSKTWSGAHDWLKRLPKGEWLERSLLSCRTFGRERFFVTRMLAISMALNVLTVLHVMLLAWGMKLAIPPVALFVIVPIVICLAAMPITPSGLGTREFLFVLMLTDSSIAVNDTFALSLSLLAYAGSLVWSLIGGVVYMTFKERHHLKQAELNGRNET
jgi:uncharacterized protein (TIRG00374 family)